MANPGEPAYVEMKGDDDDDADSTWWRERCWRRGCWNIRTYACGAYADAHVEAAVDEDADDADDAGDDGDGTYVGIALTTMCGEGDGDFLGT